MNIDNARLEALCRKWRVRELWAFGASLGEAPGPGNDLDVVVRFEVCTWASLYDQISMEDELGEALSRDVFLIDWDSIRDPARRDEVMRDRKMLYPA